MRTRNRMGTSGDARRGPDTDRVVAHFVDRELGIGQLPTDFEHNAYRMRAHDSLPNKSQSIFEVIGAFLSESEKSTDFESRSGLLSSSPRPQ
ncbi:hypothetical protein [Rhodococcus sp. IEGM 1318]|uniref:hypothetical protein n=1 Tax=Rhodococcus sp. IEGM 1318 TaxID=3082226 RepID=UPI0029534F61|nr:hypothetical protein [Rhodococcus sp. IEGM 1318]MDV8005774.1 hypothetical protein [Rhodococcus sp. IEGM 1318]